MDMGEEVQMLVDSMNENPMCKGKKEPEKTDWECRIGRSNPGDLDTPTAERLNTNMKQAKVFTPRDPPKKGSGWDLEKCTQTAFPYQSHHLIPKNHLPKHPVCKWLAFKAGGKDYKLLWSTNYDTDHARNGVSLPFASNTQQWKSARSEIKKAAICNIMMKKTGRQLHQGSHTYEDYGEEDSLHGKEGLGYLGAVDDLLSVISDEAEDHYEACNDCKKSATKPIKIRPLASIVEGMYAVSGILNGMISEHKIFVSNRAAAYFLRLGR